MRNLRPVPEVAPRAVIYLRQSTFREESISLELQEIACRDYCDRMGYVVTAVEADPGISGRTWNRPAVQRVIQSIETRSVDVVVLWKWSRLSRSRKDWALAADRVDLAGGRIESATEPIDTATASGRFARGVMTEYAAFQSEQIGEQWEEVRQRRLSLGLPASGRLPFGWRWASGSIEPNPEQAPLIPEMYRRYLSGDGAARISIWLNESNIPGPNGLHWNRVRPLTVLDSPIHAGLIPYRGKTYPGAHAAIIDSDTWEAYKTERTARRTQGARPRPSDHLLSGLVNCKCGARMYGKGSVTAGRWYGGYLCSDTLRGHDGRGYVSALKINPAVTDWFLSFEIRAASATTTAIDRSQRDRLLRRSNELESELVAAGRGNLRDELPAAAYQRLVAELKHDYDATADELKRLDRAERAFPAVESVAAFRAVWPAATVAEKNRTLRTMIDRVAIIDDQSATLWTAWGESSVLRF